MRTSRPELAISEQSLCITEACLHLQGCSATAEAPGPSTRGKVAGRAVSRPLLPGNIMPHGAATRAPRRRGSRAAALPSGHLSPRLHGWMDACSPAPWLECGCASSVTVLSAWSAEMSSSTWG